MLPAGVDTKTPSQTSSSSRTLPFRWIRTLAACLVWRSSETSLNATAPTLPPASVTATISSGLNVVRSAACNRSISASVEKWFIRKPTLPAFMP